MDTQQNLQAIKFLQEGLAAYQENPTIDNYQGIPIEEFKLLVQANTGVDLSQVGPKPSQSDQTRLDTAEIHLAWLQEQYQGQEYKNLPEQIQNNLKVAHSVQEIPQPEKKAYLTKNLTPDKLQFSFPQIPNSFIRQFSKEKLETVEGVLRHFSPKTIQTAQKLGNALLKIPGATTIGRTGSKLLARLGLESLVSGGTLAIIELGYQAYRQLKNLWSNIVRRLRLSGSNNSKNLSILGAIAIPFIIITPLAFPVSLGFFGASYLTGGPAAVSAGVGAVFGGLMSIFTAAITVTITPIVISLIVIPLMLAFVIFVITSGAYMVPPSGSLIVGTGPDGIFTTQTCFVLNGPWPEQYRLYMTRATDYMAQTGMYMDKICSKGIVYLTYSGTASYGGEVVSNNTILIYEKGTNNLGSAIYTLAHESGHIFARRFSDIQNNLYRLSEARAQEPEICTYPISSARGTLVEDFAEMIALYIYTNPIIGYLKEIPSSPRYEYEDGEEDRMPCIYPSFVDTYPLHVDFAATHIFGSRMGW